MVHQIRLRGILLRPLAKEGCPHRFGQQDWIDGCDLNEGRPCIYETAEAVQGCEVFQEILREAKEELQKGVIPMEKRKEYVEGEIITCPKCGGDDIDCEESPDKGKCLTCGLEFTVRQVAVWEE